MWTRHLHLHSNYLKQIGIKEATLHRNFRARACPTNQVELFEATSTESFHRVRIPSVTSRRSCSQTDKSNCCSHETPFHEARCEFRCLDAVSYDSGVRKHILERIRDDSSRASAQISFHMFQSLSIHRRWPHHPTTASRLVPTRIHTLFCSCVTLFWTNFPSCPFITILLTAFVHASRCSGRVLDDR